eukprot:scaffold36543_cov121-Isochrysis_galbana.AAC.1
MNILVNSSLTERTSFVTHATDPTPPAPPAPPPLVPSPLRPERLWTQPSPGPKCREPPPPPWAASTAASPAAGGALPAPPQTGATRGTGPSPLHGARGRLRIWWLPACPRQPPWPAPGARH